MDDFVEQMLKSAEKKKEKIEPNSADPDPEEVEKLAKELREKLQQ